MKWCLRVVLDGERFVTADLSEVPDEHAFGRYGSEVHTEFDLPVVEELTPTDGLTIAVPVRPDPR